MQPKTYSGNIPHGSQWSIVGTCKDSDMTKWLIFRATQEHSQEWVTVKVVAHGRAQNKANYWFGENLKTGSISSTRDMQNMQKNRPHLYAQVVAILKK